MSWQTWCDEDQYICKQYKYILFVWLSHMCDWERKYFGDMSRNGSVALCDHFRPWDDPVQWIKLVFSYLPYLCQVYGTSSLGHQVLVTIFVYFNLYPQTLVLSLNTEHIRLAQMYIFFQLEKKTIFYHWNLINHYLH